MLIKKGQLVEVKHNRKGKFKAIAQEDFDSSVADAFPLALAIDQAVNGFSATWLEGDVIPCRASLCSIKVLDMPKENDK